MSYFAVEKNTGAINGFYTKKSDAVSTTKHLERRYKGSRWVVAEVITNDFAPLTKYGQWSQDSETAQKLTNLFGDNDKIYSREPFSSPWTDYDFREGMFYGADGYSVIRSGDPKKKDSAWIRIVYGEGVLFNFYGSADYCKSLGNELLKASLELAGDE